jgi:hypothetical protein
MMLFSATGYTGIHQLTCWRGAAYQVSRCAWNAYAMPVDSPPSGNAVRSFGTSACSSSGLAPSAVTMRRTCAIDSGWWMNFGLKSISTSASSSGERLVWTVVASAPSASATSERVKSANSRTAGTWV